MGALNLAVRRQAEPSPKAFRDRKRDMVAVLLSMLDVASSVCSLVRKWKLKGCPNAV